VVRPTQAMDNHSNLGRSDNHDMVYLRSVAAFLGGVATALSMTWLVASSIVDTAASEPQAERPLIIEHAEFVLSPTTRNVDAQRAVGLILSARNHAKEIIDGQNTQGE